MNLDETLEVLESKQVKELFSVMYGAEDTIIQANIDRYRKLVHNYNKEYGSSDIELFSSPGRTEISGNHTDHNHGKVLAGSINLDCVGVAAKNDMNKVNILSETYEQRFSIDIDDLTPSDAKSGTEDLIKGLLAGFKEMGYVIGGLNAYITSNVISAAGVSSSASFEMLLCSMLNTFYNNGCMDTVAYAQVGKYSENMYWDKQSGLLDQMACAVGGLITIDFKDPAKPAVEKIDFDFSAQDHSLIIVNTGKGHADLSAEYSSVPMEMKSVAKYFGKEVCADINEEEVLSNLSPIREVTGDRPILRALHFFEENKRVEAMVSALKNHDFNGFLDLITQSGNSSWKWLQNCYVANSKEQGITIALALTELFIKEKGMGACRVHGGGFAGVIMAVLPNNLAEDYIEYIENRIGSGNAYKMSIRPYGAIHINSMLSPIHSSIK